MMNLQLRDSLKKGGLGYFEPEAIRKSNLIYDVIDNSDGFYKNHVHPDFRSRLNPVFRISGGDKDLEKKFITEARARHNIGHIGGHHSVGGGSRISIYNAQPYENVEVVANYMKDFMREHRGAKL